MGKHQGSLPPGQPSLQGTQGQGDADGAQCPGPTPLLPRPLYPNNSPSHPAWTQDHRLQMGPTEGRRPHLHSKLLRTSSEGQPPQLPYVHSNPTSLDSERPSGDMEKEKENGGCKQEQGQPPHHSQSRPTEVWAQSLALAQKPPHREMFPTSGKSPETPHGQQRGAHGLAPPSTCPVRSPATSLHPTTYNVSELSQGHRAQLGHLRKAHPLVPHLARGCSGQQLPWAPVSRGSAVGTKATPKQGRHRPETDPPRL